LLEKNADINAADINGRTAFMAAKENAHPDIMELLQQNEEKK
jgi:ankyrin repeat protein